jgi:glutathione S-transferase
MSAGGILYSFRRCPYAIRARLALAAAGIAVEVREVALKAKPPELLEASAKGTVPVWVRPDGETLEESLAILLWALGQGPGGQVAAAELREGEAADLVAECDGAFKRHLDGFRYGRAETRGWRAPSGRGDGAGFSAVAPQSGEREEHRSAALAILRRWNTRLEALDPLDAPQGIALADAGSSPDCGTSPGGGSSPGRGSSSGRSGPVWSEALGWAVLPFVRQFRLSDPERFAREPGLVGLQRRLAAFEASPAFARVMAPPWAWRQPWLTPRWLYHLALEDDWQEARRQGVYTRSTRGSSLAEVGFIHASWSHQVEPTWRRFYADGPALRLLRIDPERLAAAAIPVREEPAPGSGERFPHIYGALPIDAVRLAQRWESPAP